MPITLMSTASLKKKPISLPKAKAIASSGPDIAFGRAETEVVSPAYTCLNAEDLAGFENLVGPRSIAAWWGRDLELLASSIEIAGDVRFARANNLNRAIFADAAGDMLGASYAERYGYGESAATACRFFAPKLFWDKGRCYDVSDINEIGGFDAVDQPVLVLGFIDPQFGHFLLETLSRSWAVAWALQRNFRVLVWADRPLKPFQLAALELLGLGPDNLIYANDSKKFDELYIPSRGFRLVGSAARVMANGWNVMREAALRKEGARDSKAVYLSRRANRNRPLMNESELETLFESAGFHIVRPETLSLTEQIVLIASADRVAGCFGSQMHLSIFMKPGTRKLVIGHSEFIGPEETIISEIIGNQVDYYIESAALTAQADVMSAGWAVDIDKATRNIKRWIASH